MSNEESRLLFLITHHSSLFFYPHLAQRTRRVAPILFDLDEEFEIDAAAREPFDVAPSLRADLFEARAAAPDDDALLRRALDVDGAEYAREFFRYFFVSLGDNRRHVWNLLAGDLQNHLADEFGDDDAHRLVGQLVL